MNKKKNIGLLILFGLLWACESPVYNYFLISDKANELEIGSSVVVDGITVGKVAQIEHPPGRPNYQIIRLELNVPVNLPAGCRFIFPDSLSDNPIQKLFISPRPSAQIFNPGDTINLLKKSFGKQIVTKPLEIPVENKTTSTKISVKDKPVVDSSLVYRIQLKTSRVAIAIDKDVFKDLQAILQVKDGKLYKYYYGEASTLVEARELRQIAVSKGFNDAFIIAFMGDRRISISEARKFEN